MLKIQDLTVRYAPEGQPVLHHLALSAEASECVALVGPSGSGKTTLLRSINASVGIESGQVWVGDVQVSSAHGAALRAIRSRIAFIAQKHDLVDRLKAYQNVMAGALGRWSTAHALRFLLWPQASELEEAREALQSVGLAQKLRSRTTELSGGEQQRVAIARALVQHPLVILADEPIASLDPDTAAQVLDLLCNLARNRGITLICSLHQPDLVHRYFDRILRIHGGQVVQVPNRKRQSAPSCGCAMLVLDRISGFFHFLAQFFPPDLSRHYLSFLFAVNGDGPIVQSLSIALAGVFLAVLIALPLSIVIGTRMPGWRLLYSALAVVRSIPDLTLAIFCVILVGLGSGAGMITLVIYYAVAMAKVFGEIFLSADPRPLDALRSTGASRISLAAFGLIPLKLSDVLSYGIYELESAIRASVIVGAVGAGGIGTELVGSLNNFDYHRVTTLILALVLLIVLVDRFCWLVRRHPIALAALPPAGIASLIYCWPQLFAMRHSIETFSKMLPPHLKPMQVHELPALIFQTLGMAAGGTLCAALIALIAAPAASRGIAPAFLVQLTRRLQDFARAIPEVVWGLLLVTFVGVGPWAGGAALALHSSGVLGKLFAESLENVPPDPVRALEATGASRLAVAAFGNFPLAAGPIAVHTLFRFEWNVRAATVLGIIGAGGIGQALYESQQLFFYHEVLAYLLITCVIVGLFDFASTNLRKRYRVSWEAIE